MTKSKQRFREPVLQILKEAHGNVPHRELAHKILGSNRQLTPSKKNKIHLQSDEKHLERELRELVRARLIDRLPGNFFRLKPVKVKADPSEEQSAAPAQERPRLTGRQGNDRQRQITRDSRGKPLPPRQNQRSEPREKPLTGPARFGKPTSGTRPAADSRPRLSGPERFGRPQRDAQPRPRQSESGLERFGRPQREDQVRPRGDRAGISKALIGTVSKNARGFGFVQLENPPPHITEDIFLPPDEAEGLMTGDKVAIQIDTSRSSVKGPAGRVVRIVERGMQQTVAAYYPGDATGPYALVMSRDNELKIFLTIEPAFRNLKEGSAILVEITHHSTGREATRGRITSVLADSLDSTTDDVHIITKHKLKSFFPEEVVVASSLIPQTLSPKDLQGRKDLRSVPFITIDGADARDFDDAVCAKILPNGNYKLWVAVADVAHYVKPGSPLDREAYERGTSVYFPHRVLPMLPERLSNGICSLNPHEDRLAMVCEMEFDAKGKKLNQEVYDAVFQSQKRCVYEVLQQYYDDPKAHTVDYSPAVRESLVALHALYKIMQARRFKRGAIDLELPESKVIIGPKGEVLEIKRVERKDTHRLIEEFMIAANEGVSEIMEEAKQAFLFRVHDVPEPEAFGRFLEVAKSFGISIPVSSNPDEDQITPKLYQAIATNIRNHDSARVLHFQLLRSMKQAFYSAENLKHFGLASTAYTHFTSPIRRYPDLIVHRLLKAYLRKDKDLAAAAQGATAPDVATAAQHCSQRERLAADAEREMIKIKQVRFAEAHLGAEFTGHVSGLNNRGAYMELQEVSLEGFIPMDRFGASAEFNEKNMTLRLGKGKALRLGDVMRVQIVKTVPHLLQIDLEPIGEATSPKKKKKSDE